LSTGTAVPSDELREFLLDVRNYVIRAGIPLLIAGTVKGVRLDRIAAVRYIPAWEEVLPVVAVGGASWYPSCHRVVFWIDSGDHTVENRKVMAVAWDPEDGPITFEQVGEVMVRNYKDVASKLYDDKTLPVKNLILIPRRIDNDDLPPGWVEELFP